MDHHALSVAGIFSKSVSANLLFMRSFSGGVSLACSRKLCWLLSAFGGVGVGVIHLEGSLLTGEETGRCVQFLHCCAEVRWHRGMALPWALFSAWCPTVPDLMSQQLLMTTVSEWGHIRVLKKQQGVYKEEILSACPPLKHLESIHAGVLCPQPTGGAAPCRIPFFPNQYWKIPV